MLQGHSGTEEHEWFHAILTTRPRHEVSRLVAATRARVGWR